MDIEELKKYMQIKENKVIIDKKFYEEVLMVSMDNAMNLKKKVLKFEDWIYEEWKKVSYSVEHHTALALVIDKLNELKKELEEK